MSGGALGGCSAVAVAGGLVKEMLRRQGGGAQPRRDAE